MSVSKKSTGRSIFAALKLFTRSVQGQIGHRSILVLLCASLFMHEVLRTKPMYPLFKMNSPLCWGPLVLGYFNMENCLI